MDENAGPLIAWSLTDQLNNHSGLLQFSVSKNHRSTPMWDMLNWLCSRSDGVYGLVYVHDDEDLLGMHHYGRGDKDNSNEFRVWRLLKGQLQEFDDPFLSPIVPTILPNFMA